MHDCSVCGCACYCHGDIDDCQVETEEYAYEHCTGCGCSDDAGEFDDDGAAGAEGGGVSERLPHEFDDDACCIHCGFDGAEEWWLRVACTPEYAREPMPDSARWCEKRNEARSMTPLGAGARGVE